MEPESDAQFSDLFLLTGLMPEPVCPSGFCEEIEVQFNRHLREAVMGGTVTCSVRIWQRPHVKVGGRYRVGSGAIKVTAIRQIELGDITPTLARRSGFSGVVDLLKVARHGPGENIYLVEFVFSDQSLQ